VAPWSDDRKPAAIACLDYSSKGNQDKFHACANGINDGRYAYHNLQDYDVTWYHRFNAKWHMATEAWIMYEARCRTLRAMWPIPGDRIGANGTFCAVAVALHRS
jgi:hypothetical protein